MGLAEAGDRKLIAPTSHWRAPSRRHQQQQPHHRSRGAEGGQRLRKRTGHADAARHNQDIGPADDAVIAEIADCAVADRIDLPKAIETGSCVAIGDDAIPIEIEDTARLLRQGGRCDTRPERDEQDPRSTARVSASPFPFFGLHPHFEYSM